MMKVKKNVLVLFMLLNVLSMNSSFAGDGANSLICTIGSAMAGGPIAIFAGMQHDYHLSKGLSPAAADFSKFVDGNDIHSNGSYGMLTRAEAITKYGEKAVSNVEHMDTLSAANKFGWIWAGISAAGAAACGTVSGLFSDAIADVKTKSSFAETPTPQSTAAPTSPKVSGGAN
jgi:hypothetical protein